MSCECSLCEIVNYSYIDHLTFGLKIILVHLYLVTCLTKRYFWLLANKLKSKQEFSCPKRTICNNKSPVHKYIVFLLTICIWQFHTKKGTVPSRKRTFQPCNISSKKKGFQCKSHFQISRIITITGKWNSTNITGFNSGCFLLVFAVVLQNSIIQILLWWDGWMDGRGLV